MGDADSAEDDDEELAEDESDGLAGESGGEGDDVSGGRIFHGLAEGDAGAAAENAVVLVHLGGDEGALGRERDEEKRREEAKEDGAVRNLLLAHGGIHLELQP